MQFQNNVKKLVVDGSNVAFFTKTKKGDADFENLCILDKWLQKTKQGTSSIDYSILCDASLKHRISNPIEYEKMLEKGIFIQAPAKIRADTFLIQILNQFDGQIALISNDLYRDYPEINQLHCRIQYGFMIVFKEFLLSPILFENKNKTDTIISSNFVSSSQLSELKSGVIY